MGKDKKKKKESKQQRQEKQEKKQEKKRKRNEDVEDIDAILESFKKEQEEQFQVTEELNCPPPSRRANCTLNVNPLVPQELILFGGEYFDGQKVRMYNDLFKYNIEKNEWKKLTSPNSPGPRSAHQIVCTPAGVLFLWGGEFVSPNETNFFHYKDFWTMDLKGNSWEKLELKTRPPPRSGHRMVLWKHWIVMFGGFYDQTHETKYYDDLWVFDTNEYKWHQVVIPDPKPSARSGFQFLSHGDSILLYGGYSKVFKKGQKAFGMMHTDAWTLKMSTDVKAIRWEKRKKCGGIPPGARSGCTAVYHKGKGIVFGGVSDIQEDEETIESVVHQDMFQYAIDSNKWYPMQLKKPKGKKSVQPDSEDEELESETKPLYDETWPGPRFNPALAVTKNTLYMFGGILEVQNKEFTLSDMWSLNLDKLQEWNRIIEDETALSAWVGEESDDDDDDDEGMEDDEENESEDEDEDMEDLSEQVQRLNTDQEKKMTDEEVLDFN
jgi:N-acetylneuraminic acid mutarotase